MASKSDLWAQRRGFKNYYEYRNYLAQMLGYKNYNQQRKARKLLKDTGDTKLLTTDDYYRVAGQTWRKGKSAIQMPKPGAGDKAQLATEAAATVADIADLSTDRWGNLRSIKGTSQWQLAEEFDSVREALKSRKKYDGDYRKATDAYEKHRPRLSREISTMFHDPKSKDNFVRQVYTAGARDAVGKGGKIDIDESYIAQLSYQTEDDLRDALETAGRKARFWDKRAQKVTNKTKAKRHAAKQITGGSGPKGNAYRLDTYEKMVLNYVRDHAYNTGLLQNWKKNKGNLVRVSDGPQCGWEEHNDPLTADGLVMTVEEGLKVPLAHPNCVRTFSPIKPKDDKEKKELESVAKDTANRIKSNKASRASQAAKKTAQAAAGAAAIAGIATTELDFATYNGTVGDWVLTKLAQPIQRTLYGLALMQNRMVDILQRKPRHKGYAFQLRDAAKELVQKQPELSEDEAFALLADQVHQQTAAAAAADGKVGLFSRKVLGLREGAPMRELVAGAEDFDEYFNRLRFFNQVPGQDLGSDIISTLADINESQSFLANEFARFLRPIHGRFSRLTFPTLSTLAGESRRTRRYARLALNPNDLVHAHVSARPLQDGTLRRALNVRLNPNGMMRFGFIKNETGALTPTLALVPKGPLRIYSRVNRAKPTVTKVVNGVSRTRPNARAGFVNTVTTRIQLKTGLSFLPSLSYKFRLDLRALGIKNPQDILKINRVQFRRMLQDNNFHKMINAGTELRLKAFNIFDIKRTLTMNEEKFWRWRAYGNTGINMRFLLDFWRTEVMRLADSDIDQGFYETIGRMLAPMDRLKDMDPWQYRNKVHAARQTLGHYYNEIAEPVEAEGLFGIARYLWHLSERQVALKTDQLTDWLILHRRTDLPPIAGGRRTVRRLTDTEKGYITKYDFSDMRTVDDIMVSRPKLITAIMEVDPKDLAKDLGARAVGIRDTLANTLDRLLARYMTLLPIESREEIVQRLARADTEELREVGRNLDAYTGTRANTQGTLHFFRDSPWDGVDITGAGGEERFLAVLRAQGLEPGSVVSAEDLGGGRVFDLVEDAVSDFTPTRPGRWAPRGGNNRFNEYYWEGPSDLVEFVIDGQSVQRVTDGGLELTGDYRILSIADVTPSHTGWTYGDLLEGVGETLPEGGAAFGGKYTRVRRVYLEQVRSPRGRNPNPSELTDLAVAANEMDVLAEADHLIRQRKLREAYPDIVDAAENLWDKKVIRRIRSRPVRSDDGDMPVPFAVDEDGYVFIGWHSNAHRDWQVNPGGDPYFFGGILSVEDTPGTERPKLFASIVPESWHDWVQNRHPDADQLWSHEIWVKGPVLDKISDPNTQIDIEEFLVTGQNQIRQGRTVAMEAAEQHVADLHRLNELWGAEDTPFEDMTRIAREMFTRMGLPETINDAAIANLLRQDITPETSVLEQYGYRRLKELVDSAPKTNDTVSKQVVMSRGRLDRMIERGEPIEELFGIWDGDLPDFTLRRGDQERVVLVARESRAVNLSPLIRQSFDKPRYLVSGRFQITSTKEVETPDGEMITFVYVKYLEPVWNQ